jgi:hypothetical protein
MHQSEKVMDHQFLEMRWRCLSLAADLDRVQRAAGGDKVLRDDERLRTLRDAIRVLLDDAPGRAERVQMLFSVPSEDGTWKRENGKR